jgi:eukaryotic-like serine/threonine-protein kinase
LRPNYLCGLTNMQLHRAHEAAAEFQAVLDRRGLIVLSPIWELSQLGLARAYAMQDDKNAPRSAYEKFLALMKDADPDIPILQQAKAEYARRR